MGDHLLPPARLPGEIGQSEVGLHGEVALRVVGKQALKDALGLGRASFGPLDLPGPEEGIIGQFALWVEPNRPLVGRQGLGPLVPAHGAVAHLEGQGLGQGMVGVGVGRQEPLCLSQEVLPGVTLQEGEHDPVVRLHSGRVVRVAFHQLAVGALGARVVALVIVGVAELQESLGQVC